MAIFGPLLCVPVAVWRKLDHAEPQHSGALRVPEYAAPCASDKLPRLDWLAPLGYQFDLIKSHLDPSPRLPRSSTTTLSIYIVARACGSGLPFGVPKLPCAFLSRVRSGTPA